MELVLSDFPRGKSASELAALVAERYPEFLQTPGRKSGRDGLSPMSLLSAAVNDAGGKYTRFLQDKSVSPQRILLSGDDRLWTDDELRMSVKAYLVMREHELAGTPYVKVSIYQDLASQLGRPEKSIERRMQNISAVLSRQGRRWVSGLLPARNVGAKVAQRIAEIIAEEEGLPVQPMLQQPAASKALSKVPEGNRHPSVEQASVTRHVRDAAVRSWVLENAKGRCESCQQDAPFRTSEGPFLEVHHVRRLVDRGADTVENAVALCPNCHRRLHYGVDAAKLIDDLYRRVDRLKRN